MKLSFLNTFVFISSVIPSVALTLSLGEACHARRRVYPPRQIDLCVGGSKSLISGRGLVQSCRLGIPAQQKLLNPSLTPTRISKFRLRAQLEILPCLGFAPRSQSSAFKPTRLSRLHLFAIWTNSLTFVSSVRKSAPP